MLKKRAVIPIFLAASFLFALFILMFTFAKSAQALTLLPPSDVIYLSTTTDGIATTSFGDEDIIAFDTASGTYSMFFDGSDVGITTDIDAFAILTDSSVLMSFDKPTAVNGVGTVDNSDIVRFVPTQTGVTTAGTFELYFDGSDVGLTTKSENIDAIGLASDGSLILSTNGSFNVPGLTGKDVDLMQFSASSLGSTTSGTWSLFSSGSSLGLDKNSEDINGVDIGSATGEYYFSVLRRFSGAGASGDGADIFHVSSGGSVTLYWDGSSNGLSREVIDGFQIVPAP